MTTQDKDSGWSIKIGGGFGKRGSRVYPKDRLEKFLTFNPKSKRDLGKFCTEYQIIPPKLDLEKDNILEIFLEEQSMMRLIAKKIVTGLELSDEDYNIIESRLGNIRKSITRLPAHEVDKINHILSGECDVLNHGTYPIDTFIDGNSIAALWDDLARLMVSKKLSVCCCGAYYQPSSKHRRKYCTPSCGDKQRQSKFRAKMNK